MSYYLFLIYFQKKIKKEEESITNFCFPKKKKKGIKGENEWKIRINN